MEKRKVIVSACLLGERCKYSGGSNENEDVKALLQEKGWEPVPVCPEVMGGLQTPRTPAELRGDRVVTKQGRDVTAEFLRGAEQALALAREHHCTLAILKEKSPSCGSGKIYDGSFSGTLISGDGKTAQLFKAEGVAIVGETRLAELFFEV